MNARELLARQERERIASLLSALRVAGFVPVRVHDGGEYHRFNISSDTEDTDADVIRTILDVEESTLTVRKGTGGRDRNILLVLGNGDDGPVSDYAAPIGDPDGFVATMDAWIKSLD